MPALSLAGLVQPEITKENLVEECIEAGDGARHLAEVEAEADRAREVLVLGEREEGAHQREDRHAHLGVRLHQRHPVEARAADAEEARAEASARL